MESGSWNGASFSKARVDSAVAGSQDEASLFWTSVSFEAKAPATPTVRIQKASTTHFVTRPVSFPATCRCIRPFHHSKVVSAWAFSSRTHRSLGSSGTFSPYLDRERDTGGSRAGGAR